MEAFEELLRARGPALLRLARLLTGSAADAEDLLQSAVLKAWPHAGRIVEMAAPTAYLRRVLLHEHLSRVRAAARRPRAVALDDHDAATPDLTGAVDGADHAWRLLATLPPKQRAVLVLRVYEDLPDREIAEALGVSEATVRSNASRGLATLRAHLSTEGVPS